VVEAECVHHIAVGGRWHVICELGVALPVEEASDVEASSPSARLADDRESCVREHRPRSPSALHGFVSKFQIRDHGLIGQLVSDIVGFKRAATGQSNAKGCRTRLLGSRPRPHPSGARVRGMKSVRIACLDRTIIIIGAMFVWAWASQAQSQNLDCNNGCATYAQYALAQRLHLPESIQNLPRDEIATWFSHHPQYSRRLKALAGECESSCAKCGDWTCR
jgi:hypothetical protein